MAKKTFKAGVVLVEFTKDFPYLRNYEVDKTGKFTAKPIEGLGAQFKKDKRVKLRHDIAGKIVGNGYANLLNEKNERINTKALVAKD